MAKMLPLHSTSSLAEIEERAYCIFHSQGRPVEREIDHWLQAEGEFIRWVALVNEQRDRSCAGVRAVLRVDELNTSANRDG